LSFDSADDQHKYTQDRMFYSAQLTPYDAIRCNWKGWLELLRRLKHDKQEELFNEGCSFIKSRFKDEVSAGQADPANSATIINGFRQLGANDVANDLFLMGHKRFKGDNLKCFDKLCKG